MQSILPQHYHAPPRVGFRASTIQNTAIAIIMLLSGFVVFEPAPYEMVLVATLAIWLLFGLKIPRGVMPLVIILTFLSVGGILSSFQVSDYVKGFTYVAVSYYLGLSAVFFAIVIAQNPDRLELIFKMYVASAIISTILGLLGYFDVSGFELFTKFTRSRGAFKDPNVYGPYLVAPILYLVYRLLNDRFLKAVVVAGFFFVLLLGLLLAFSRAAWGLAAITGILFYALLIINERSAKMRLKYFVLAAAGAAALVAAIVIALQFDAISSLFSERVKVVQDYDGGRLGRFARHAFGFELALSKPFGIGPLEFDKYFEEDTHNNLVKALMAYGWIGFVAWLTMIVWTLAAGFKLLFRPRPWQVHLQIAYLVFLGHNLVGIVIDTDHWRHFYLVIGIIWGCIILEKKWQNNYGAMPRQINTNPNNSKMARAPINTGRKTRKEPDPAPADVVKYMGTKRPSLLNQMGLDNSTTQRSIGRRIASLAAKFLPRVKTS